MSSALRIEQRQVKRRLRLKNIDQKKRFIKEVRMRPLLWNKQLKEHRDRLQVDAAWSEVASLMHISKQDCKSSWKNLIDTFRKLYKDTVRGLPSGFGVDDVREVLNGVKWVFFKPLLFVHDADMCQSTILDIQLSTLCDENHDINDDTENSSKHDITTETQGEGLSSTLFHESSSSSSTCFTSKNATSLKDCLQTRSLRNPGKRIRTDMNAINDQIQTVTKALSTVRNDSVSRFCNHMEDLIRLIPSHLQTQCMRNVTQIVHTFIDDNNPVTTTVQEILL